DGNALKTAQDNTPDSNKANGATGRIASMRSYTPPWPGSKPLESLRPARRLSKDSNKSPTMDIAPSNTAASSASGNDKCSISAWPKLPAQRLDNQTQATAPRIPATAPAIVLPGLTFGASLRLPNARPAK